MHVKFVDLSRTLTEIKEDYLKAIDPIIDNSSFIFGPAVSEFEKNFASYLGINNALGCASGTDALVLSLRAMGIGRGDEVILPANTFIATSEAVRLVGATPVFVDCREETFLINDELIEESITPATKAVIPVHLYGRALPMDIILGLAKKHSLRIIEDTAQAHGASIKGEKAGTFGDCGCFSFYPSKNLGAFGDGGAVVTNNDELALKITSLRNHGSQNKTQHNITGYNSRLDSMQAAVLSLKLSRLDGWNDSRRKAANIYLSELKGTDGLILPQVENQEGHVWHLFVVHCQDRDKVREKLGAVGVDTGIHYPVALHEQPANGDLGYKPEDCPVASRIAKEILSLPMFPGMTEEECLYVCDQLKKAI